jgi:TonB family protein
MHRSWTARCFHAVIAVLLCSVPMLTHAAPRPFIVYLVGGHELVYHEFPYYPETAVFHRWEGSGVARLHVRSDGTVSDVKFVKSTGYQRLDIAAREAFSRGRFRPEKAPFTADVPCDFRLGDKRGTRAVITPLVPKA